MIQNIKISNFVISSLQKIVGQQNVYTDEENLLEYGHDETESLSFPPNVLVKPENTSQVAQIMKLAFENIIPVTPIGARTGLSGGSLCVSGGIGLSMEKFNNILKIDEDNLQVVVEPGVITQELQDLSLIHI